MNGFHFSGGIYQVDAASGSGRVIAQVELPPGYYIIFAKVELQGASKNENKNLGVSARLELGGIKDEIDSYSVSDEEPVLIALNIAGEVKHIAHAKLVVNGGLKDPGYNYIEVRYPRLSAIQVSELTISSGNLDISDYVDHVDSQELLNAGIKTSNLTSFKSTKSGG